MIWLAVGVMFAIMLLVIVLLYLHNRHLNREVDHLVLQAESDERAHAETQQRHNNELWGFLLEMWDVTQALDRAHAMLELVLEEDVILDPPDSRKKTHVVTISGTNVTEEFVNEKTKEHAT